MWTQADKIMVTNMVYSLRKELIDYGFDVYAIEKVRFTTAVKVFGMCRKNRRDETAIISISEICLHSLENTLRDTILHELCHAMPNTTGHDKQWKQYVAKVNNIYGTNIGRLVNREDSIAAKDYKDSKYKYAVHCTKCGRTWKFYRMGKIVKQTMGYDNYGYYCPVCGKDYFECEDLTTGKKYVRLTVHTKGR